MRVTLSSLWKVSPLPILLLIALLFGVGLYLQVQFVRIQGQPLRIHVSMRDTNASVSGDLGFEGPQQGNDPSIDTLEGPAKAAIELLNGDDTGKGIMQLQQLMNDSPSLRDDPRVLLSLAMALQKVNRYQEALAALDAIPGGSGNTGRIHFSRGLIYNRMGLPGKGEKEYLAALEAVPLYYEASFNLGTMYLEQGKINLAIDILVNTIPLAGVASRAKTLYNLAIAHTRNGQYTLAEKSYIEAINLVPQNLKARINLARIYRDNLDRREDAM